MKTNSANLNYIIYYLNSPTYMKLKIYFKANEGCGEIGWSQILIVYSIQL